MYSFTKEFFCAITKFLYRVRLVSKQVLHLTFLAEFSPVRSNRVDTSHHHHRLTEDSAECQGPGTVIKPRPQFCHNMDFTRQKAIFAQGILMAF
jgi:hypothetical protein